MITVATFSKPEEADLLRSQLESAGKTFINCATLTRQVHLDLETAAAAIGAKTIEGCMASSMPWGREDAMQPMIGGKKEIFNGKPSGFSTSASFCMTNPTTTECP